MDDRDLTAWRVIHASVQGRSHEASGTPRQDDSAVAHVGAYALAVVADGAGSAPLSREGARRCVNAALDHLVSALALPHAEPGDAVVAEALTIARAAVVEAAAECDRPPRDLACTAIAVVAGPTATVVAHVGDGAVVGLADDGALVALSWPENGEYANTTFFLTDDEPRIRVVRSGPVVGFAAFTDGLQHLALDYATRAPFDAFFTPFFTALRDAEDGATKELEAALDTYLAADESLRARADDDLTLVVGHRV